MKLSEIKQILDVEIITDNKKRPDFDINRACGSDLMSDVLAFVKPDALLLTGLTTIQVIYTADASGIKVVCFVRGKKPPRETVALAKEKKITLLSTKMSMFDSCGKLFYNGLMGFSHNGK